MHDKRTCEIMEFPWLDRCYKQSAIKNVASIIILGTFDAWFRSRYRKDIAHLYHAFVYSSVSYLLPEIVETTFSFPKFRTVPGRFRFFYVKLFTSL